MAKQSRCAAELGIADARMNSPTSSSVTSMSILWGIAPAGQRTVTARVIVRSRPPARVPMARPTGFTRTSTVTM